MSVDEVRRVRVSTRDAAEAEEFVRQMYVGNRLEFLGAAGNAGFTATAAVSGRIAASRLRSTVGYRATTEPFDHFFSFAISSGRLHVRNGGDEQIVVAGETAFYPTGVPLEVDVFDLGAQILQLPLTRLAAEAERTAGIRAEDLRFSSTRPVSAAMARQWFALQELAGTLLLTEGLPAACPLVAEEMTRTVAIVALHTFPNNALDVSYRPGPGWVAPAAVRRAAAFLHAHADQAITLAQIAEAAGVSGRALQYAFRRHFDTTPVGYLRRIRLERADQELRAADPAGTLTVADVAYRWGWFSPSRFIEDYQRRFGILPGTLCRNQ
ncbi:AraC family transcriptional regulator [Actinoplanes sp. NPDC026619]|uniref:AraC family transcriptional regulator n=1 Tax=Actinoplanes sp. NPDC026619 TaxID=3155798 RepID=UPI0033C25E4B